MNVAIVGLGLMGGSLALSLKKLDFIDNIVGSDHNKQHQKTGSTAYSQYLIWGIWGLIGGDNQLWL